jgi:hypothetical protein
MGKKLQAVALVATAIAVSSCPDSTPQNSFFTELPGLTTVIPAEGNVARAPVTGEIVELPETIEKTGKFGKYVSIKTSKSYWFDNQEMTDEFTVIVGNLAEIEDKEGPVANGEVIGKAKDGKVFVLVMADRLDRFLVCSSTKKAEFRQGVWWFTGDWLHDIPENIWLGYQPAAGLDEARPGKRSVSLRRRIPVTLEALPSPTTPADEEGILTDSRRDAGRIASAQTVRTGKNFYVLCWAPSFDEYLRDEYEPGKPLWIFGTLVPSKTKKNTTYVFVHDYLLAPIETLYDFRVSFIHRIQKEN